MVRGGGGESRRGERENVRERDANTAIPREMRPYVVQARVVRVCQNVGVWYSKAVV